MKGEGWFIRYGCKRPVIIPVDEHERFLRDKGNKWKLRRLGLSNNLIEQIPKMSLDRTRLLRFVLCNAPIIRVRVHNVVCTFEYWDEKNKEPLNKIYFMSRKMGFGDYLFLNITNLYTKRVFSLFYSQFRKAMRTGKRIRGKIEHDADVEQI